MIHAYASQAHYFAHLHPIHQALPDNMRGQVWSPAARKAWGVPLPHARRRPPGPVLVASYVDHQRIAPTATVLVEHGAGQTYESTDNGSYSGGIGLERVVLFIAPSERVAQRWRDRYPATPAVAVGCPRLDALHRTPRPRSREIPPAPVVSVTFHFDSQLLPETMSALRYYRSALPALRDAVAATGGELWGHGHPRAWGAMERLWRSLGVRCVPDFADVLDGADLLVCDNSSAMWEAASCGIPLVVLDAPWYRRDVDHGLRFWAHADAGVRIQESEQLVDAVFRALEDPPEVRARREAAVADIYVACDGRAGERAAGAIVRFAVADP